MGGLGGIMRAKRIMGFGSRQARQPIEARRAERELFFWTARQTLKLVIFAALTAYLVMSLAEGRLPGAQLLIRYL
jgi:hypothetical protein